MAGTGEIDALSTTMAKRFRLQEPVYVTRPSLPNFDQYSEMLKEIWSTGWLTNRGPFHDQLEAALAERLEAAGVSLFCNGTIALLVALQALGIEEGEVITTPFTFPATVHAIHWNRLTPVFCDIDPESMNLNPAKLEALVTPRTRAILPVHVFGNVCDVDGIDAIAKPRGLPVVYDAAHAFGVRYRGRPVTSYGDMSMLSFHATKTFTTIEGGALISPHSTLKRRVDFLKNFGIADEETVIGPGINGKLNEVQAAFGLLQLEGVEKGIERRRAHAQQYREGLSEVPGINIPEVRPDTDHNYSYFPIRVDETNFGLTRDEIYMIMKASNIHPRKYFHPLCSRCGTYQDLPGAAAKDLPEAEKAAQEVLCLPLYADLESTIVAHVVRFFQELCKRARS